MNMPVNPCLRHRRTPKGRRRLKEVFTALLAVASLAGSEPVEAGNTGGAFLPQGHGARAHALGGAGVASTRDDAATYWNPAQLAWLDTGMSITFMRADILPGVEDGYNTLSFARRTGELLGEPAQAIRPAPWGYGIFFSNMGFDFDSGVHWSENTLQLGVARALNNYASIGIALKALRVLNDFEAADAKGVGFDIGLTVLVWERLTAAVEGRDTWTRVRWDTGTWETLERSPTFGLDYRPIDDLDAVVDLTWRESSLYRLAAGLEWHPYRDVLRLRGGLTRFDAGRTTYPSVGVGIRVSRFEVDWAASFDDEEDTDLGQRVSLRVSL